MMKEEIFAAIVEQPEPAEKEPAKNPQLLELLG
jgi:hypothetical protein